MNWDHILAGHRAVVDHVDQELRPAVEAAAELLTRRIQAGGKLLLAGNGGSAADAQHFACELVNQFLIKSSRPWPALALTTDSSILTSVVNDHDGQWIFAKQVEAFGQPGDVFIAISTSGNSPNLVLAADTARQRGLHTLGLLGGDGGRLLGLVEHAVTVGCTREVPRIQEAHLIVIHALCEHIEAALHALDVSGEAP